jgi:DUF971 family protein
VRPNSISAGVDDLALLYAKNLVGPPRRAFFVILPRMPSPTPTEITLHAASRVLEITFDDGRVFKLPFEFLRVYSPSAEVRGHSPGQETLQVGKRDVTITQLDPVGHYAVQPVFSDGHSSGIYSWSYLYELGTRQEAMWAEYLRRLDIAGASREAGAAAAATAVARKCGQ